MVDESGNKLEYCVKESDDFLATYSVVYKYNGKEYFAGDKDKITVGDTTCRDTGYAMSVGNDGISFGTVTVSNRAVVSNTIPSTGGEGICQFIALGILLMAIALAGIILFKKRRVF